MSNDPSRRKFLQQLGTSGLALASGGLLSNSADAQLSHQSFFQKKLGANEDIHLALIGAGIMGNADADTALKVPGVRLTAACDLYSGRLARVKEKYGADVFTSRDYREILDRKDIDAVIIATADLWHARIATEALKKGKHVYCEKPMVKKISEGLPLIETQKQSSKVFQVGSQPISGFAYQKAKQLLQSGEIGQLNCIEATYDRHSALGAWQYTLPTDASIETVDWDRFISGLPKEPFNATKFFRWRNYKEFGSGVAGDLFVHLLTGIHMITGSKGPSQIISMGDLSFWKDGRNVPDIMTALMHYPSTNDHPPFLLTLRVNFASGAGEKTLIRFIGDAGVITLSSSEVSVSYDLLSKAPGMADWEALSTYPVAMQQKLVEGYNNKYTKEQQAVPQKEPVIFKAPDGEDRHLNHFNHFFDSIKKGTPVFEDAVFGFRAAAPCLACNTSYFDKKIIKWDPVKMKIVE